MLVLCHLVIISTLLNIIHQKSYCVFESNSDPFTVKNISKYVIYVEISIEAFGQKNCDIWFCHPVLSFILLRRFQNSEIYIMHRDVILRPYSTALPTVGMWCIPSTTGVFNNVSQCLIHHADDSSEVQKHSGERHWTGGQEGRESNTHRDPKIRTRLFQLANEQRTHWAKERAQGHCQSEEKGERGRHKSKRQRSSITCFWGS